MPEKQEARSAWVWIGGALIAAARNSTLLLSYAVTGRMRDLQLPPVVATTRADELWRHTCFEAFLRSVAGRRVLRIQLRAVDAMGGLSFQQLPQPDTRGERAAHAPDRGAIEPRALRIAGRAGARRAVDLPSDAAWRLGLAAVIEETSGHKSYWALAHPPGKPDFHHSDGFAYELPPA